MLFSFSLKNWEKNLSWLRQPQLATAERGQTTAVWPLCGGQVLVTSAVAVVKVGQALATAALLAVIIASCLITIDKVLYI